MGRGVFVGISVNIGVCVTNLVGVFVGVRANVAVRVTNRVGVRVTNRVGVASMMAVWVSRLCVGAVVNVTNFVCEGTGVNVTLAVKVGVAEIRGVAVGVEEAVFVGAVWVGNGPSSACAVPARAVLILSRSPPLPPLSPNTLELPNVIHNATKMKPRNKIACSVGLMDVLFFLFTLVAFLCSVFR